MLAGALGRLWARLAAANAAQISLWEGYLAAQRPWEAHPAPLRWSRTAGGWRLRGSVLPAATISGEQPELRG